MTYNYYAPLPKTFFVMDNSSIHQNNFPWDQENEGKKKCGKLAWGLGNLKGKI